jgi:hypothetical protein
MITPRALSRSLSQKAIAAALAAALLRRALTGGDRLRRSTAFDRNAGGLG